ncbi:unnamed protein product [Lactuca virosa]|uniref:Uncharacterized protein n=1 Tax=Lactuca virosa TaxID=75947 RepID=A0AAU9MUM8_9ASTR|nr:unnamed protein product [Lactuca virosa]
MAVNSQPSHCKNWIGHLRPRHTCYILFLPFRLHKSSRHPLLLPTSTLILSSVLLPLNLRFLFCLLGKNTCNKFKGMHVDEELNEYSSYNFLHDPTQHLLPSVTMEAQKEAPPGMQCKDKFLLQSAFASLGTALKDITPELFNKESGNQVDECKLKINYDAPPLPPSPVREGSEEGSSPRGSIFDNGIVNNTIESNVAPRSFAEEIKDQENDEKKREEE